MKREQGKYAEQRFKTKKNEIGAKYREESTQEACNDGNVGSAAHNSVGHLQELCMARGLELPRYSELGNTEGGQFSIQCGLGAEVTAGHGPNKVRPQSQMSDLMIKLMFYRKKLRDLQLLL